MNTAQRYPEEFRIETVEQILGHSVADISRCLGLSTHSLYKWIRLQQIPATQRLEQASQSQEMRRLKAELKRVTEERGIDRLNPRRRTSLVSKTEVRLHCQAAVDIQRAAHVPGAAVAPQWLLRLENSTAKPESYR